MTKGSLLEDTFEQLVELGQSTAKKTVKSVAQTLNPFDKTSETQNTKHSKSPESSKNPNNHTPVDFDKLKNKFQDKDKLQAEALRNRLFQIVKREDEKILERKDMEEAQKKRQEEYLAQEKKKKEQQQKIQGQQSGMPTGKAKRGFMSRKKTSEQQHVENKPASGKQ
ncbi:MAG: hypothetical protein UR54_C0001G0015 [Candidatus Roizmanbacteria bacterium GW2011_GWA2_34_18]|uniref:Uncharacterized protein n=1 Tax=Candidatus Roizmanbacteria bacterium GW2011_GWA2_34_18 TaxID=1618477 RepID=A0A0G0DDY0_9BACT|nr:MAG: hypothetical protein UR54_C0001G0015 [Candidatus Roizmanbacteria bacterium GW2011_GWA2_34_18]